MGMEISNIDLENTYTFAERVIVLSKRSKHLMNYLRSKMRSVASIMAALIEVVVDSIFITEAGSSINIGKAPLSSL
ncbi:unnamed protein product [Larinioides sclopetarius]|uniref:Nop domain-containing protein n=1 Tax=Larinioides sclopetarius TaxID=280406 RepID=A0AAV2BYQ3_9ARAC